jgi:hypothetical protein
MAVLLCPVAWAGGNAMSDEEVKPPSSFEIPFDGPGQLATIWSWGRDRPSEEKALVLTGHGQSRRVDVRVPRRVRWRSPTELLVEQYVSPMRDGSIDRLLRMNREGEILEVLSDREGLGNAEPSPDGERVLLERDTAKAFMGLEVWSLVGGFRMQSNHPRSAGSGLMTDAVWNPDGSKFAVGRTAPDLPLHPGRLYFRINIASRDAPGYRRIPDSAPGEAPLSGGVLPLFWNPEGIYGRTTNSDGGLVRCDPEGSGCTPVYVPGPDRAVLEGRAVDDHQALLLVKDFTVDALEARSKEIHQVNLATGEGTVLLRVPDGVFLNDLDWIGDARKENEPRS